MQAIGEYLRSVRAARGITPADMARRLGHRKPAKGVRRLLAVEATGVASGDMLVRLAEALGLDWVEFEAGLVALGWHDGNKGK